MLRRVFLSLVVFIMSGAGLAFAQTSAPSLSSYSQDFVNKAQTGNAFEVRSSQVALEKSSDPRIKQFAQQMITDHTRASDELKSALAEAQVNVTVKTSTSTLDTMDAAHQKILDDLKSVSGKTFNENYISAQADAHTDAVAMFRDYSNNGDNDVLKTFAVKTLPTLEKHKQNIDTLLMLK